MGLIVSGFIGYAAALLFAYILYWLDRYEKEPLLLLGGVFLWGAVVAAGSAFLINTTLGLGIYVFTGSNSATDIATGSFIAPLVEETLKGLAVLGVFLVFRREFDSVLDGIIYAGVAALGFAATENTYYIYTCGFQQNSWSGLLMLSLIRVVLVGWQHPFYTAFFGIGLALARLYRNWFIRVFAPIIGLGLAMFTHAFHNTVAAILSGGQGLVDRKSVV
jgi:protease PrsW